MSGFGDAPMKGEGSWVSYDPSQTDPTPEEIEFLKSQPQTTWIEFSIPEEWEEECWDMINAWRKKKYEESDDASDK